jgi:hypothetical protein
VNIGGERGSNSDSQAIDFTNRINQSQLSYHQQVWKSGNPGEPAAILKRPSCMERRVGS